MQGKAPSSIPSPASSLSRRGVIALRRAAAVCAARKRLAGRDVRVTLPGGDLFIRWREDDDHILMAGPVEYEFEGDLPEELFSGAAA